MRFAGSSTTPPPHETTDGSWAPASTSAAASIARNAASPSASKISVIARALLPLDLGVEVDERHAEPVRELASDHGLARAGHAHQVDDHAMPST